jgi:hypothetical protein
VGDNGQGCQFLDVEVRYYVRGEGGVPPEVVEQWEGKQKARYFLDMRSFLALL